MSKEQAISSPWGEKILSMETLETWSAQYFLNQSYELTNSCTLQSTSAVHKSLVIC